jgi:threonine dehydratase
MTDILSMQDVVSRIPLARQRIAGAVYRTPLEPAAWLSDATGALVSLKLECYQPTGSFKVRGALTALSTLDRDEQGRRIIAATAGNHGLGLAYAAQRLGLRPTIVIPENASPAKVAALQRFPLELIVRGADYDAAERATRQIAAETGAKIVSAYNDPWVLIGQATIGAELLEDEPELDMVLIPTGGGAILAGIGAWLKTIRPSIAVIGVQSEASPAMKLSLEAGHLVDGPVLPTLADGLSGNIEPGSITFALAQQVVDAMILVSEAEIASAIRGTYDAARLLIEGSAAVGIAALLEGKVVSLAGKRVAVVVTGRNIAVEKVKQILA